MLLFANGLSQDISRPRRKAPCSRKVQKIRRFLGAQVSYSLVSIMRTVQPSLLRIRIIAHLLVNVCTTIVHNVLNQIYLYPYQSSR